MSKTSKRRAIGVSVKTLQRWDRDGILKANRTPTDRRYYTCDQYLQFKGIQVENDIRDTVIYARVSTRNQKDDLQNQVEFLKQLEFQIKTDLFGLVMIGLKYFVKNSIQK